MGKTFKKSNGRYHFDDYDDSYFEQESMKRNMEWKEQRRREKRKNNDRLDFENDDDANNIHRQR